MAMKKAFYFIIVIIMIVGGCKSGSAPDPDKYLAIIPAPVSVVGLKGDFVISEKTKIVLGVADDETKLASDFLANLVRNSTGISLPVEEGKRASKGSIFMTIDTTIENDEGYVLTVSPKKVIVKGGSAAGLFYGVQTIRQLMPAEAENPAVVEGLVLTIPACEIEDEPRFGYRGMHLDVGRHMFPIAYIKRYIDMIALHKMNRFHWHLTEDQGWRIEITQYPKLTEVGAYRKETLIGHGGRRPFEFDGERYGGFYTQEEVKEIVEYARNKFITVIPEIEMPGHALAALASYPELGCTGGPYEVQTRWGVFDDVFCAGKEETFEFLENVLSEVMELFPSEYIHIGGDECPKTKWEKCPLCQKRIEEEGLENEHELQSYFIQRIEKFVLSKGKRIIGWDEILEGGLAPEATVMSWRGTTGGIEAAKMKHDVIMTPYTYVYLDYYQSEPQGEPLAIGGYLPLEKVYSFNPMPEELTPEEQKYILGVQGNLWSEYLNTPEHMEYMAYPRMFAIAESGWTPDRLKDFEDFLARFEILRKRYDAVGINYFKGEYRDTRAAEN